MTGQPVVPVGGWKAGAVASRVGRAAAGGGGEVQGLALKRGASLCPASVHHPCRAVQHASRHAPCLPRALACAGQRAARPSPSVASHRAVGADRQVDRRSRKSDTASELPSSSRGQVLGRPRLLCVGWIRPGLGTSCVRLPHRVGFIQGTGTAGLAGALRPRLAHPAPRGPAPASRADVGLAS